MRVALTSPVTSNTSDRDILEPGSVVMAKRQQTFKRAARKRKARQHAKAERKLQRTDTAAGPDSRTEEPAKRES